MGKILNDSKQAPRKRVPDLWILPISADLFSFSDKRTFEKERRKKLFMGRYWSIYWRRIILVESDSRKFYYDICKINVYRCVYVRISTRESVDKFLWNGNKCKLWRGELTECWKIRISSWKLYVWCKIWEKKKKQIVLYKKVFQSIIVYKYCHRNAILIVRRFSFDNRDDTTVYVLRFWNQTYIYMFAM